MQTRGTDTGGILSVLLIFTGPILIDRRYSIRSLSFQRPNSAVYIHVTNPQNLFVVVLFLATDEYRRTTGM